MAPAIVRGTTARCSIESLAQPVASLATIALAINYYVAHALEPAVNECD